MDTIYGPEQIHIVITAEDIEIERKTKRGCPQGGVLSPFLWNLVIDELLSILDKHKQAQAYADDLYAMTTGICPQTIFRKMNTILKEITNWCEESGLKISTPKTHVLLWTRTRDRNIFPTHIIINHAKVTLSDTTKYLGIIINNKLNFNDHIDHQVTTCKNSLFAAKRIIDKNGELTQRTQHGSMKQLHSQNYYMAA